MKLRYASLSALLLLAGCAADPTPPSATATPPAAPANEERYDSDPIEGFNRAMWFVNYDILEPAIARPIVHGYADYIPQPLQNGVANFVSMFDEPSSMVNHLLTGNLEAATTTFWRFTINGIFGLGGFVDIASDLGLKRQRLEMTTIFGHLGMGEMVYFMIPGYGPTTLREQLGDAVDHFYFPYNQMTLLGRIAHWGFDALSDRVRIIDQEPLLDNSLDPYAFSRSAYLQSNQKHVDAFSGKPEKNEGEQNMDQYLNEIDQ